LNISSTIHTITILNIVISINNMLSREFDIIIVGAGPAGCIAAKYLSENYNVLLIDQLPFPRNKPCGGILIEDCKKFVKKFNIEDTVLMYPHISYVNYIDLNNDIKIKNRRNWLNINRKSFDSVLLSLCQDKVVFMPETKFLSFRQKDKFIHVSIRSTINKENFFLKTKYLIGADGANSSIRKNLFSDSLLIYFAIQEWIETSIASDTVYFVYDDEITDYYSWIIPKGNYSIIGSAIRKTDIPNEKLKILKEKIKNKLNIYGTVLKRECALGVRPTKLTDIKFGYGNVLLIGEAAGLISPSSGEGISFALKSGENCATAINENPSDALNQYKKLSQPLLSKIYKNIIKARMLSNKSKRVTFFENLKI